MQECVIHMHSILPSSQRPRLHRDQGVVQMLTSVAKRVRAWSVFGAASISLGIFRSYAHDEIFMPKQKFLWQATRFIQFYIFLNMTELYRMSKQQ